MDPREITTPTVLDAEQAFCGCLLRLPLVEARPVLAGMRASDCGNPAAAHVLQLVIEVIAHGQEPHPVTVFAHAQTTGAVHGEHATHRLSGWLLSAYEIAPAPATAGYLKAIVLEHAWRRALVEHANRVLQAADADADDLHELAADSATVDDLYDRYQAAVHGETPRQGTNRWGVAA